MDPNKNKNELINQGTTQQPQQFQNSQEAYSVNVGPTKYGPKKKIIILMASITILVGLGLGGSLLFKAQKRYEDDQVGIAKNQKETSQKDLEVVYSRWLPTMDWESSPVRKSGIVAGEIINNTQRTIEPEILVYWPRYNREYWPRDNREETSMQKPRISKRFLEPGEKAAFSTYISTDFPGEY
ncbi:MAG: hypothetical protein PHT36_03150, partial [Patescibacteria group bacterium]|nr:hypothetical protein [Patescibacteria group bacterium]